MTHNKAFDAYITFIVLNPDDASLKGGVQFLKGFILRAADICLFRGLDHLGGSRRVNRARYSRSRSNHNRTGSSRSRGERRRFDKRSLSFFLLICLRSARGRRGRAGNYLTDSLILDSESNLCLVLSPIKD